MFTWRSCQKAFICMAGIMLVFGCSRKQSQEERRKPAPAREIKTRVLNLYNWKDYIGSNTLKNFEKETGIQVHEINFQEEEEVLGAVQSNLAAFDLVVSSDELVRQMVKMKLLAPFDYTKIPNFKYIGQQYRNPICDPEQKYTIPYLMGSTGMVVNKKYIKGTTDIDTWNVLWDSRYRGKLAMLNNPLEVVSAACKLLGYSINTVDFEQMKDVTKILTEQKKLLQGYYDINTIKELMIKEDLWAAQVYSGEGLAAADENKNIEYIIPKEGATIWMDFFVMPRDAVHQEEAHEFLNYILRPEVIAPIASELWYATPNEAARPLMNTEVVKSRSVYPPQEVMIRCEFIKNTGEVMRLISPLWSDLTVED